VAEEKKVAVYICKGCGIGDAVDVDKIKEVVENELKVPVKVHDHLCSEEAVNMIKSDISSEGLTGVVIAACSPRVKKEVFDFGENVFVERVNLREGVAWTHEPKDENTQMMAEDYVKMGVVRAQKAEFPEPYIQETSKDILVVGGGVTGLTAAIEIAKAGYKVYLVEKEAELGGWAKHYAKILPGKYPYKELVDASAYLDEKIKEVEGNPNITVYTSTRIKSISGQPGMFDVTVTTPSGEESFRVGAIVVATGWKPYDPSKLENLGYGKYANVVTNIELERMLKEGKLVRPSDGKPVKNVAFILCAGQRDPEHIPYCSTVCCMTSLKEALCIRELDPKSNVYIFYRDMRTVGIYEEFYKNAQQDEGIFLTKGTVKSIYEDEWGDLIVEVTDTLLGEDVKVRVDLVVLATGMLSSMYGLYTTKEEYPEEGEPPYKHIKPAVPKEVAFESKDKEWILNLQYRQGPELPTLRYGMPDSHYICFPYESRRTGIYAAGCVRAPMTIRDCEIDARGAALKAIQTVELVAQGKTIFPRTGDIDYPNFFLQRCTQCKRCTEECPFGALDEDEKGTPQPNPLRCRRCGICFGACPEKIISFKQYSVDMISSMLKVVSVPEGEDKPRIIVFACENDAYPAIDMAAKNGLKFNPFVRIIPVRCLGSVNVVFIADSLSRGIDGILLLGCKYGEDYQCHFIRGSELANRRMENVQETLQRLFLEPERVKLLEVEISDWPKIPEILDSFVEEIKKIGPNPYKGF